MAGVFLQAPGVDDRPAGSAVRAREKSLVSQSIIVIHLLAASLRVDRSLPTAIRFASRHAGGVAAQEFERLEWAVRIRHFASVDEAFAAFANRVGAFDPDFKRALLTLQGAESESTREGLERRLDRAYDMVVASEERRRDKLTSTLERPAVMLFGTAIVMPLVMASLFPMLQLAGGSFGLLPMAALLLVAVPFLTLLGASRILDANFLATAVEERYRRSLLLAGAAPGCAGFAAFALSGYLPNSPLLSPALFVPLTAAGAGVLAGLFLYRLARPREAASNELARDLPDLLHAVGSRMIGGRSAEQGLLDAVEASAGSPLAARLRDVLFDVIVGRRSLAQALDRDEPIREAGAIYPSLRLLASAADRDAATAGRIVLHLAEFERRRTEAAEAARAKVRAIIDTTRTTTAIFAPLILGVTAGMYDLLSAAAQGPNGALLSTAPMSGARAFAGVLAVFLSLEVALAEWFAARMTSPTPASAFGKGLARALPLSLALFGLAMTASGALF